MYVFSYSEGYEVLATLHANSLSYAKCGQPFSTTTETRTLMSMSDIAALASDVCIKDRNFDGALDVLSHCEFGVDPEKPDISARERDSLKRVTLSLVDGFLSEERPEQATEVFFQVRTIAMKTLVSLAMKISYTGKTAYNGSFFNLGRL